MDGAFQATVGLDMGTGDETGNKPLLPFALQEVEVLGDCSEVMWALIEYSKENKAGDKVRKIDIDLCDEQGNVQVRIKGYTSRVLEGRDRRTAQESGSMLIRDGLEGTSRGTNRNSTGIRTAFGDTL